MANIVVPEAVRVWKFGVDQANVLSWNNYTNNQGYHLFCTTNGKFFTYVDVNFGINVGFKDKGDNKTHFRLPDGQEREILSGESVALGIGGSPSFIKSAKRDVGIDLKYEKEPAYEWRIFGADSELGKPIPENAPVALCNDEESYPHRTSLSISSDQRAETLVGLRVRDGGIRSPTGLRKMQ